MLGEIHTEIIREFMKEMNGRIQTQAGIILAGNFSGGFDRYQRECGKLSGFQEAWELMQAVLADKKETVELAPPRVNGQSVATA